MKVNMKYSRILWSLKKLFKYSQKYSPKGYLSILFSDVRKNLFYDNSWEKEKKLEGYM